MPRSIPHRAATCAAFVIAIASAAQSAAGPEPSTTRFTVDGAVHAEGRSADGRFAGGGEARFVPQANSADGRFALKATHAPQGNCASLPDLIFASGFEP